MAIGIFDSGLGGLSVLKYVLEKYNDERIVYFADTLNFPYGTKSTEELIGYGRQIFDFFLENNVTEVIIACNTASATMLPTLEKECSIPIIGVIKPISEYIIQNDIKDITLIATQATINSKAYDALLKDRIKNKVALPELVKCAENMDKIGAKKVLEENLKGININYMILGCTHFPLLKDVILEVFPNAKLIDPAKKAVEKLQVKEDKGGLVLYTSSDADSFYNKAKIILKRTDLDVRLHKW